MGKVIDLEFIGADKVRGHTLNEISPLGFFINEKHERTKTI